VIAGPRHVRDSRKIMTKRKKVTDICFAITNHRLCSANDAVPEREPFVNEYLIGHVKRIQGRHYLAGKKWPTALVGLVAANAYFLDLNGVRSNGTIIANARRAAVIRFISPAV
jgi:hypothetical protein